MITEKTKANLLKGEETSANEEFPKQALIPDADREEYLQLFTEQINLKGKSSRVVNSYCAHFKIFIKAVSHHPQINLITNEELEQYLLKRQNQPEHSKSNQEMHIRAISFYYENILRRAPLQFTLLLPKRRR